MIKIILLLPLLLLVDATWGLTDTVSISPGQFPSYASVVVKLPAVKDVPVCGGVIISDRYILTSGQCDCVSLKPTIGLLRVRLGVQTRNDQSEHVQVINVDKVFINKKLKNGLFMIIKEYDIGLLKLAKPIVFTKRVQPAKLPAPGSAPSGRAIVVGLGAIAGLLIPEYPGSVRKIEVELIGRTECTRDIKGYSLLNTKQLDKQLCSKPVNKKATACIGDSGDPLIQRQGEDAVVIGILSWAPWPCRQANAPIVYTSVSQYLDWIQDKIKNN